MDELTELEKLIAEEETAANATTSVQPQDSTDLQKRLREEEAKKKHWREKAVDPTTGKTYKALYEESTKKVVEPDGLLEVKEEITNFKLAQKGLDEEAINFIKAFAKGSGKDAASALEDPAIQTFLEARRQKQAIESAIPSSSSRTVSVGGKTISEMTPKERAANWEQIVAATRKK